MMLEFLCIWSDSMDYFANTEELRVKTNVELDKLANRQKILEEQLSNTIDDKKKNY